MTDSADSGQQKYRQIRVRNETYQVLKGFKKSLDPDVYGGRVTFDRAIEIAVARALEARDPKLAEARRRLNKAESEFISARERAYREAGGT